MQTPCAYDQIEIRLDVARGRPNHGAHAWAGRIPTLTEAGLFPPHAFRSVTLNQAEIIGLATPLIMTGILKAIPSNRRSRCRVLATRRADINLSSKRYIINQTSLLSSELSSASSSRSTRIPSVFPSISGTRLSINSMSRPTSVTEFRVLPHRG